MKINQYIVDINRLTCFQVVSTRINIKHCTMFNVMYLYTLICYEATIPCIYIIQVEKNIGNELGMAK